MTKAAAADPIVLPPEGAVELISDEAEIDRILDEWRGATFLVSAFNPSFRRMLMRAWKDTLDVNLALLFVGCQRIEGAFEIRDADLSITRGLSVDGRTGVGKIEDRRSGFSLLFSSGCSIRPGVTEVEFFALVDQVNRVFQWELPDVRKEHR
ncbi:hypothetical protein [Labrys wisconsinensis]|uniref:Uncharacterized protein n=1 Tax=Labrys wisconsinensis TaxID=425677 RepID=A0ABU0JBU3_9HYPH|nr:hypothetical protein [Labrys wisconsinensis]MDQ0471755.1 hypothetical protein [Labrys wisconsinensis]